MTASLFLRMPRKVQQAGNKNSRGGEEVRNAKYHLHIHAAVNGNECAAWQALLPLKVAELWPRLI